MSIVLGILTFVLVLVSLFLILVVLAQKSKDGGMGAALGGGAAEAAFGAETGNVLFTSTKYSAILFFVLAFVLYLGRIYERKHSAAATDALPNIAGPAAPAPSAATTPPLTVPTGPASSNTTAAPAAAPVAAPTTPAPAPSQPAKTP